MALAPGQDVDLLIEKPAAGGRMIARHEGQVVLVLGAIPGECVTARVDRVERRLAFAKTTHVTAPSPDRRSVEADPLCGGCLYAHISYSRQVAIKADVIADAYRRIGRIPLASAVAVTPSPELGYRLRARLHVRGGRAGFYREGTHEICDAAVTGQLLPASAHAIDAVMAALTDAGAHAASIELSENIAADERALHIELSSAGTGLERALAVAMASACVTGCTGRSAAGDVFEIGRPAVGDPLSTLTGVARDGVLRRRPESFFQGNRYLLPALVKAVLEVVPESEEVLDLYAGVGLFSVALACAGRDRIIAVEGDRAGGADLWDNVRPWGEAIQAVVGSVEDYLARHPRLSAGTIIVDPPRTGISKAALDVIARRRTGRLVYVSCDPATMARDARRLLDGGYRLESLRGFDLFPNTPHVETLGVFEKG
jgi:23S rRNA (uracil1939-C5)-methyltransferase